MAEVGDIWENRWKERRMGWDIGYASPAITQYFDRIPDKTVRILIPGCGNAYEAEYLFQAGFEHTWVIDIAPTAIESFLSRFPNFPASQAVVGDFFEHVATYDFIVEQTFFCALNPVLRSAYAEKMSELLAPGGKLVGLLFDDPALVNGPPFGGNAEDYQPFFAPYFQFDAYSKTGLSIPERKNREFFVELLRK